MVASVYTVFNLAWTETASRVKDHDSNSCEYYTKMFDSMLRCLTGAVILLMSLSSILFDLLVKSSEYNEAYSQVSILYVGVFLSSIVSFLGGIYIANQKTKSVGISSIVGALVNIVINVILIEKLGLYAASLSTVISFGIIAVYRLLNLRKTAQIRYNRFNISICVFFIGIYSVICRYRFFVVIMISLIGAIFFNTLMNKKEINKVICILKDRLVKR